MGYSFSGTVSNSYATGDVSGTGSVSVGKVSRTVLRLGSGGSGGSGGSELHSVEIIE